MSIEVILTEYEEKICEWVGRHRFRYACQTKRDAGEGPSRGNQNADNHIRGAKCEYAASILLNVMWRPNIGVIDQPDIGLNIEVRSTDRPNGRLIVKPAADDKSPYVLIIFDDDKYRCVGWFLARDAKKYPLRNYPNADPAFYIDQCDLLPLSELRLAA